jgi:hypothetical protein
MFTELHRASAAEDVRYEYVGLSHGAPGPLSESIFGPGENAIVDFKYSPSPKLTWWFDHHQSAFLNPADRAHFEADYSGKKFFDDKAISCTGFIARVGREQFGMDTTRWADLLKWADIVDGARFESAQSAVEMKEPALRLALVIENAESDDFIPRVIPLLTSMPLEEVVAQPFIAEKVQPLLDRHLQMVEDIRQHVELRDGTIYLDLTDQPIEGLNKFIPYFLLPEATYTVALTRSHARSKLSVGTNPWTTRPAAELANIAEICHRFGGGGHARVGAVSYTVHELDRARVAAAEIVRELRAGQR